jgi:hypothetical protein
MQADGIERDLAGKHGVHGNGESGAAQDASKRYGHGLRRIGWSIVGHRNAGQRGERSAEAKI